ncbi:MAG: hypothetical protein ABSB59_25990 [Streptosporangiaceae bacterium]
MTADPEARGGQWRPESWVYGNRSHGDGMRGDGMYADGTDGDLQGRGGSSRRGRRVAAVIALALGVAGFAVSLTGVAVQLLPRHFTAHQQRQIEAWEVMRRWQLLPAGKIFPASVSYQLSPDVLQDVTPLRLNALRVSIAPQESDCIKAVTSAAAGAVLRKNGCQAVLRATYVDATRSFVMTVGVAVLPDAAAAVSADSGLTPPRLAAARRVGDADLLPSGVLVLRYGDRSARAFDYNRQISASFTAGPYVVMYAAGYSDGRPRVPVSQDKYSEAEMTSMAAGVAHQVASTLDATPPVPHCPGASGC